MGLVEMFVDGVLPPVAVATPALLYAWKPWRRSAGSAPDWPAILAIGAAPIAASISLAGMPAWPPVTGGQWLLYCLLASVLVACVAERFKLNSRAWHAVVAVLCLALPPLVLMRLLENSWQGGEVVWHLGVASALCLVPSLLLTPLSSRRPGPSMPIALMVASGVAGYVLLGARSALLGQLAGALSAALGLCVVCGLGNGAFVLGRGAILLFSMAFGGLLLSGHHFAELSPSVGMLVWAAPLSLWLLEFRPLRSRPFVAMLPCFALLGLAAYWGVPEPDPYGY